MKDYILPIFLFLPMLSFGACPNINGEYLCRSQGDEFQERMNTRIENNVYIYEFHLPEGDITTLYADGKFRPMEIKYGGLSIKGKVKNKCSRGSLNTFFSGRAQGRNQLIEAKTKTTKTGNKLHINFSIYINSKFYEKVKETCTLL